jgi:hypothetical protein
MLTTLTFGVNSGFGTFDFHVLMSLARLLLSKEFRTNGLIVFMLTSGPG